MTPLLLALTEDEISAGPIGLLVVALLFVAVVFLIRSMNSRLKNLPRDFPRDDEEDQSSR